MNSLLTTGEMIDSLDIGRTAKCVKGENLGAKVSYNCDHKGVRRLIVKNSKDQSEKIFTISDYHKNSSWVLIPTFVSFQEAMEALNEGNTVYFHGIDGNGTKIKLSAVESGYKLLFHNLGERSLHDLYYGKWSIKEDGYEQN
ncbi:hypothetical protein GCM10008931_43080 [Oceanobacillus oncorhynchi subsp. oncorhynchi]|uniref:hypothetical protein n=1 Tax=Oceanobacillus oncorhynchi TaxID=545501 RepID=UPI0031DA06F1